MKASKFSEPQIAFVLKQAEGDATVADLSLDRAMLQDRTA